MSAVGSQELALAAGMRAKPARGRGSLLSLRSEKACAWMAVPALAFFTAAMIPAFRFLPPLSPMLGASEIADRYLGNAVGIQLGAVLMMFGAALLIPFVAALSSAMLRMGGRSQALASTQLACGVLTFTPLFLSGIFFAVAVFRPDRPAEHILLLSDLGWLFLVMPTPGFLIELAVLGFAILNDTAAERVFPRWVAYFNLWIGVLALGGVLCPLFKHGPFAWNGLFAYWVPLVALGLWVPLMVRAFMKSGHGIVDAADDGA